MNEYYFYALLFAGVIALHLFSGEVTHDDTKQTRTIRKANPPKYWFIVAAEFVCLLILLVLAVLNGAPN
jgi:uncharacterized integral membrane protein